MGSPAARQTDMAGHGGVITTGATKVLIGGMPAARVGDMFTCPGADGPKPHVMGNIIQGSTSVIIEGAFAARLGDLTGCGAAGVVGIGMPPVIGPATSKDGDSKITFAGLGQIGKEKGAFLTAEGDKGDNVIGFGVGTAEKHSNMLGIGGELDFSIARAQGKKDTDIGEFSGNADFGKIALEGGLGLGGFKFGLEGSAMETKGAYKTPQDAPIYVGGEGEKKLFTAKVLFDFLFGTDGRRTGIGLGGELSAAIVDIKGKAEVSTKKIPWFNGQTLTIEVKSAGGPKLPGGLGGKVFAGLYHDNKDEKLHLRASGKILFALTGVEADVDVMFGIEPAPPTPLSPPNGTGVPLTPGSVSGGCPTVLIG